MNYLKLFDKYNYNFETDEEDDYYINNLAIFYNPNPKQKCPLNSKAIIKKFIDKNNDLIMKCSKDSGWNIKIIPAKYINLNEKYSQIRNEKNYIIYKISLLIINSLGNNNFLKNFKDLQDKYKVINKEEKEIFEIFEKQKNKLKEIKNQIIEIRIKLNEINFNRKKLFNKLNKIEIKNKKLIIKNIVGNKNDFKNLNKKNINIENLIKITNLNKEEITNWINWFFESINYFNLNKDLNEKIKLLDKLELNIEKMNKSFIILLPEVQESKNLKFKNINLLPINEKHLNYKLDENIDSKIALNNAVKKIEINKEKIIEEKENEMINNIKSNVYNQNEGMNNGEFNISESEEMLSSEQENKEENKKNINNLNNKIELNKNDISKINSEDKNINKIGGNKIKKIKIKENELNPNMKINQNIKINITKIY